MKNARTLFWSLLRKGFADIPIQISTHPLPTTPFLILDGFPSQGYYYLLLYYVGIGKLHESRALPTLFMAEAALFEECLAYPKGPINE